MKSERTSIDDLSAVGYELAEEHLRLAAGGRTSRETVATVISGGGHVDFDGTHQDESDI